MHIRQLLTHYPHAAATGVPDWMLGYYKRYAISFYNGQTDTDTHVCWFQSRNFTIDLRLPKVCEQLPAKPWAAYSREELQVLADYEGWEAPCEWRDELLSWQNDTSHQLHNRWQEPAQLRRIGNCMIEFSPSGAYVEDWRLQVSAPGPLVGLRLIHERECETGHVRHRGGGLILCGDYAALVLGRANPIAAPSPNYLRELADQYVGNAEQLSALFGAETSVARGDLNEGYEIFLSTRPGRAGESLLPLDGFAWRAETGQLVQRLSVDGVLCERVFDVDTVEPLCDFNQSTPTSPESERWYQQETQTLTRYTRVVQ
ncbi:hypothetical protein [Marinimicrobium alkaliphilum]|uniref:hypothetical protein n=1 Tax=Marinimicrobium alkaliphilum TaxID=2202654 RepID=UPI000DB91636|nr:hypothetical protein [Marinimicrobium alkaliphilum]